MESFNKLVRDKIPDLIKEKGQECIIHEAGEEEFRAGLVKKLAEEVGEFTNKESLEEMADIMEVIDEICKLNGWGKDILFKMQKIKREKRGGFDKRIILEKA